MKLQQESQTGGLNPSNGNTIERLTPRGSLLPVYGVRVSVTFHLTLFIFFRSVSVAE